MDNILIKNVLIIFVHDFVHLCTFVHVLIEFVPGRQAYQRRFRDLLDAEQEQIESDMHNYDLFEVSLLVSRSPPPPLLPPSLSRSLSLARALSPSLSRARALSLSLALSFARSPSRSLYLTFSF